MTPQAVPHCRDVTGDYRRLRAEAQARGTGPRPYPRPATPPAGSEHEGLWLSLQLQADAIAETLQKLHERLREAAKPRFRGEDIHQMGVDRLTEKAKGQLAGFKSGLTTLQRCAAAATRPEEKALLQGMLQRATAQLGELLQRYQSMLGEHARAKRHQAKVAAQVRDRLPNHHHHQSSRTSSSSDEDEAEEERLRLQYLERGLTPQQAQQLALQELLVNERDAEIRGVLRQLEEVHEMFRDVHQLVAQQGEQLDRIDANLVVVREDVTRAHAEIQKARAHQKDTCLIM